MYNFLEIRLQSSRLLVIINVPHDQRRLDRLETKKDLHLTIMVFDTTFSRMINQLTANTLKYLPVY